MSLPHAHVTEWARASSGTSLLVVAVAAFVFGLLLAGEHMIVKHGPAGLARLRVPVAAVVAISLAAIVAPAPTSAQGGEVKGLPDLTSDPAYIWYLKDIEGPDGPQLVMAFDGYLHNVGEGSLDVYGNPQIPGDMKQRVFDGETWTDVGAPTVRYETNDGHNHFHLISVVDYALWDEGQTQEIGDGSKVGFCLLDTELMEERYDQFYDIDTFNYCEVDNPEATELRMGITPGWRDTYDSNTTLQWVDVSNVRPGRYWIASTTDPNDEIVESDESNNGIVFSTNKFAVYGYVARPLPTQRSSDPIVLKADPYGTVGRRAFTIVTGPEHGSLDVPIGADLLGDRVVYVPDEGFEGTDTFSYVALDTDSRYPLEPTVVTVSIEVAPGQRGPTAPADLGDDLTIDAPASATGTIFEPLEYTAEVENDAGPVRGPVRWFGKDLPAGLTIDEATGIISGIPRYDGEFEATIIARIDGTELSHDMAWSIATQDRPTMFAPNAFSTPKAETLRLWLGTGTPDATYEGSGLPEGALVVTNLPLLTGDPEEIGVFDIVMRELIDGEVTQEFSFTWTIRPSPEPAFPL